MKAKNVAKSIDVIIGGLEDLKKELLEADVETTEEAVEAEAPKTRKTSKKSESVSDNKVSKKTKATTKAAKVEEEDEDDGDTDYASMKYNDLKKLAVERGMKSPNVSKDELIAFLSGEDVDDEEEDVESEAVENETDEEDLTDTVTKLLDGVDTEDIAGFLTENGISAKGKRPSLIAKIVTAIEDGDLSLEDLEVEDDEEESSTKFTLFTSSDHSSYILSKQSQESEKNELESSYNYRVVNNGIVKEEFSYIREIEGDKDLIKFTKDGKSYKIKSYVEDSKSYIKIKDEDTKEEVI